MGVYRRYENPYKLEQELENLKHEQENNPDDVDLAISIHELEERINLAWQDDEAEMEGYE